MAPKSRPPLVLRRGDEAARENQRDAGDQEIGTAAQADELAAANGEKEASGKDHRPQQKQPTANKRLAVHFRA
ncbi:hypothetical protein [Sphingobium yanoikuyae]|uniref:hypothetical protein n=1 Tax=Sphingobium yanoikuyae TaxID=13690 RepID=UPI00242A695A|nr:hypothetical protein [Sphingobium yanoikuyae]